MKNVLLLLCEGFEILEAAAFYDVLGWSGTDGEEPVRVVTTGLKGQVSSAFGMKIIPDIILSTVKVGNFDGLAIPGGFETYGFYNQAYSDPVADLIRQFNKAGKPIATICVGALALGYSGIIAGRRATTYHLQGGQRRQQLAEFGVNVVDEPIVHDGNIITSTSPATATNVAFLFLAELTGERNAAHIRQQMGFDRS